MHQCACRAFCCQRDLHPYPYTFQKGKKLKFRKNIAKRIDLVYSCVFHLDWNWEKKIALAFWMKTLIEFITINMVMGSNSIRVYQWPIWIVLMKWTVLSTMIISLESYQVFLKNAKDSKFSCVECIKISRKAQSFNYSTL